MTDWIKAADLKPPNSNKVLITDGKDISCAHWFDKFAGRPDDPGEWVNQHERITGGYIDNPTHWAMIDSLLDEIRFDIDFDPAAFPFDRYDKIKLIDDLHTEDQHGTSVKVPEGATGKITAVDYGDTETPYEVELYYEGDTEFFDGFQVWVNPEILERTPDEE